MKDGNRALPSRESGGCVALVIVIGCRHREW